jgi:SAM-dependent methyltransferase
MTNVTFVLADSSAKVNNGRVRIPVEDHSVDVIISRRGPVHWIADAKRVIRHGGVLIQLCMMGRIPQPAWNAELPESLKWDCHSHLPDSMLEPVKRELESAEIKLHSFWTFDVPARLDQPEQFYRWLTAGRAPQDIPPYEDVADIIKDIFFRFGHNGKFDIRQRRLLWKAVIE